MENVLSLIKRDHDEAAELFTEIRRLVQDDELSAVGIRACFHRLKQNLVSHLSAEEEAVYARLREKEVTEDYAYNGIAEHGVVLELLEKMSNDAVIGDEWKAQFKLLRTEVERHVEEEELELFPLMKQVFSEEELVEMAKDLEALRALVQDTAFAPPVGLKTENRSSHGARPGAPDVLNGF